MFVATKWNARLTDSSGIGKHGGSLQQIRPMVAFRWDENRRLRAMFDVVFFHLYGITDRDDVRYVYSTFPIVGHQETAVYGEYRSETSASLT